MKSLPTLLAVGLCALGLSAFGDSNLVSGVGTGTGASNSVYVVTAARGGTPVVEYLNATTDKAGSEVQFWTAGTGVLVSLGSVSGTNLVSAGGFTAADTVLIRAVGADLYQKATVSSATATNLVLTGTLTSALSAGDVVYKLTAGAKIPVGAATISVLGPCYAGQPGLPLALSIVVATTNTCSINLVTASLR